MGQSTQPADKPGTTSFYVAYSALLALLVLVGFGPSFYLAPSLATTSLSSSAVLHGIVLSGWYLLFLAQTASIALGRTILHRRLGRLGGLWAVIVTLSSAVMIYHFALDFEPGGSDGELIVKTSGLWANLHLLVSFTLFATLGLAYRAKPEIHKRFMMLASISMMAAAITRIAGFQALDIHPGALTFIGMFILLCIPMFYDRIVFSKVHPVYLWWSVVYFFTLVIFAAVIPLTAFGRLVLLGIH